MEKIDVRISKIRELEYYLDPFTNPKEVDLTYSIDFTLHINSEDKALGFYITISYHPKGKKEDILAKCKVYNEFFINNLEEMPKNKKNQIGLPIQGLKIMLGLSVSHTRALFSSKLFGTPYQNLILPIIDPGFLLENMFQSKEIIEKSGNVFNENNEKLRS